MAKSPGSSHKHSDGNKRKSDSADSSGITTINKELGIVKREARIQRDYSKHLSPEYREKFLLDLLERDLDIKPGDLLQVTFNFSLIIYPEISGGSSGNKKKRSPYHQIKKTDILLFLGIRYESESETFNARVLLDNGAIVLIPFSTFREFYFSEDSKVDYDDFSSFFSCLLVKYDLHNIHALSTINGEEDKEEAGIVPPGEETV